MPNSDNRQIGIDVVFNVDDSQLTAAVQRAASANTASRASVAGNPLSAALASVQDNIEKATESAKELVQEVGELQNAPGSAAIETVAEQTAAAKDAVAEMGDAVAGKMQDVSAAADDAGTHVQDMIAKTDDANAALDDMAKSGNNAATGMANASNASCDAGDSARVATQDFIDLDTALKRLENVGDRFSKFSSAMVGFGASAVEASGEFEQLKAKLTTVQHSTEAAASTFENAKKLAASTPFDVRGVVNAAVQLEVYGQSSKELLPVVANLAAAMGGDISAAATAMGRALSGSSEGLQSLRDSFGITYGNLEKFGAVLNKQGGIALDTAEHIGKFKSAITALIDAEFAGGIERQAATVAGALGNLEDEVTNAKAAIGDQLSPYVTAVAEQAARVVESIGQIPPVGVGLGVAATAVIGLSGAMITACTSAMAFKSAMAQLGITVGTVTKSIGGFNLVLGAVGVLASAAVVYMDGYIVKQHKLQQAIAEVSKTIVDQRQSWDSLRMSMEKATQTKVKFSKGDKTAGALDLSTVATRLTNVQLMDALGSGGDEVLKQQLEKANNTLANKTQELEELINKRNEVWGRLQDSRQRPGLGSAAKIAYENQLQNEAEDLIIQQRNVARVIEQQQYLIDEISPILDKLTEGTNRIAAAEKAALADADYVDFATQINDLKTLADAADRARTSLAGLYDVARGQTQLSDAELKDDSTRAQYMGKLLREGKQDSEEYGLLQSINAQKDVYVKAQAELDNLSRQAHEKKIKESDAQYQREQAGRDRDLAAERKHAAEKLKLEENFRQSQLKMTAQTLQTRTHGWLPGEREGLEEKKKTLQQVSEAEVKYRNQIYDLDKQIALQSLASDIETLNTAANELASSVTANSDDVVNAYDQVVKKVEAWAQANRALLAASPEVKQEYTRALATAQANYRQAVDNRGNRALQDLQDKAAERLAGAGNPVQQLDAVRENLRMLQQALRVNQIIKDSDAARVQLQRQIVALGKQELSLKERIAELQKHLAQENENLDIQLKEDELSDLQARAQAGENVQQAMSAKEQEIHQMKLDMIAEEEKAQLDSVKGQAALETEVLKKYATLRQLEENRFNRLQRQHRQEAPGGNGAIAPGAGQQREAAPNAPNVPQQERDTYKPGSPLMTMQEALNSHNQWYANQVNSTEFEDRIAAEKAADHAKYLQVTGFTDNPAKTDGNKAADLGRSLADATPKVSEFGTASDSAGTAATTLADALTNAASVISAAAASIAAAAKASASAGAGAGATASASAGATANAASDSGALTDASLPTTNGAGAATVPGNNAPVSATTVTNSNVANNYNVSVNGTPSAGNTVNATAMVEAAASMVGLEIKKQYSAGSCL